MKQQRYRWNEKMGIMNCPENRDETQALQLLVNFATLKFRRECGKLLVVELNKREAKK